MTKRKKGGKKSVSILNCLPTVTTARPSSGNKFYEQSRGGCTDFTLLFVILVSCCSYTLVVAFMVVVYVFFSPSNMYIAEGKHGSAVCKAARNMLLGD